MSTLSTFHVALEFWGIIFCGCMCLVIGTTKPERRSSSIYLMQLLVVNSLILLADALARIFRGDTSNLGYIMVRVSNFFTFALGYTIILHAAYYFRALVFENGGKDDRKIIRVTQILCIAGLLLLTVSQFTHWLYDFDSDNKYFRGEWYWTSTVIGLLLMVTLITGILRCRRDLNKYVLAVAVLFCAMPAFALILQYFFYGISFINIFDTISIMVFFFLHTTLREREIREKTATIREMQGSIWKSQIQPHFIFNSLTVIQNLISKDPEEASEAVTDFSQFLRGSMDAINSSNLIPFKDEMRTTMGYLSMEKRRFVGKLTVTTDIKDTDFKVPPLSIQPLAENAVRHGIRGSNRPGTLLISTRLEDGFHIVEIKDNGAGFDTENIYFKPGSHIGVANVRGRIESLCGGTLDLKSRPGKGTIATIRIPEEQKDA